MARVSFSTGRTGQVAERRSPSKGASFGQFVATGRAVLARLKAHNVVIMTAGIAFYATLAMVPTLLAIVSVYSIVTDPAEITGQIDRLTASLDEDTALLVTDLLSEAVKEAKGSGPIALTIGILFALFSASSAMQKLMLSINLAYGAVEGRKGWKVRGLAYLFTAGAIVGVVAILFVLGALPKVMSEVGLSGPTRASLNILRFPMLGFTMGAGLTVLYRYGPDRPQRTPWRSTGAITATITFLVFAALFSLYFSLVGDMPASYGVLGSIAALIIFFQLAAISVIVGAEVNAVLEEAALLPFAAETDAQPARRDHRDTGDEVGLGVALVGLAAIYLLGRRND